MQNGSSAEVGFADLGRIKLHFRKAGEGSRLVLLLHGFPEFSYSWRHQLNALADEFTVVAPDMRGYNLSDKPSGVSKYKIGELVEDVAELVSFFGHEQCALIGHDWGAAVAWAVSQKKPEILWKLGCLQVPPPVVWKKNQTLSQFFSSWYMFFFQVPGLPEWLLRRNDFTGLVEGLANSTAKKGVFTPEDFEEYKKAWAQPGALESMINYYRANVLSRMFGSQPRWKKIDVPTLFIYGEKDHAVLPQTVQGIGDMVGAEYTELRIPEAGHWVQLEAREKVTNALRDFLRK